jgi:hypothetical protein
MKKENTFEEWQKECPTLADKLHRIRMISDEEINGLDDPKLLQRTLRDIHKLSCIAIVRFIPCVGCGYCCCKVQCGVSLRLHGFVDNNICPSLHWNGVRHVCKAVLENPAYKEDLSIGAGCSSPMLNSWREDIKNRIDDKERRKE